MQPGTALALDSRSNVAMNSRLTGSSQRPDDLKILHKHQSAHRNYQPFRLVDSSINGRLSPVHSACEDDRPNNWLDCFDWPTGPANRTIQQAVKSDGRDKLARHFEHKHLRDKPKTSNVVDSSVTSSALDLPNEMPAFVKQHMKGIKTSQVEADAGINDFDHCIKSSELRLVHMDLGSQMKEDKARASCIWTALSDLLPQSKASLDQMDSSEVVTQIMKIRDSLRSASSLMYTLNKQPDSETKRLQQDYLDAILEILQKQETCYLVALQRALVKSEDASQHDATAPASPKSDFKSEEPTELEISDSSNDELENAESSAAAIKILLNNQRPIIEDHIGNYSDTDLEVLQENLRSLNESSWADCLALQRVPTHVSSHASPSSFIVKEDSALSQKLRCDQRGAVSQDQLTPPSRVPLNIFSEPRNHRPVSISQRQGQDENLIAVRNRGYGSETYEYSKSKCNDNLVDCTSGSQEDMLTPSDINSEAVEDLSILMKKRRELESFLVKRSHQLKELQQHHDMLKELLRLKEEHAALIQSVDNAHPAAGNNRQVLNSITRSEDNASAMQESVTIDLEGPGSRALVSPTCGASLPQKSLTKEGIRVKRKTKDSVRCKGSVRISDKQELKMESVSLGLGRLKDRIKSCIDPRAINTLPNLDIDQMRRINDAEDVDVSDMLLSETENKYLHKSCKQFEIEEECASTVDDGDDPNSSLALRDEPLNSQSLNREDEYNSELHETLALVYNDGNTSDHPENLSVSDSPDTTIMKLQRNMGKLLEAKKELETLRNLLHCGSCETSLPGANRMACESDQSNIRSGQQAGKVVMLRAAAASSASRDDPDMSQKLSLLKVANERLDRLKLVMDEVQKSPGISSLASPTFTESTLPDGVSTTKTCNTSRASNLMSRMMQFSKLSSMERSGSQCDLDKMVEQQHSFELDHLFQLVSDEKSPIKDKKSSLKAPCHTKMNDTIFIRNSLPESFSSHGTSRPVNGSHGVAEIVSQCVSGGVKGTSKNSSATNISNVSCVPCVSRSVDGLHQISAFVSQPHDKNCIKPCRVIRNQHATGISSDAVDCSFSSVLPKHDGKNKSHDTSCCPKKGVNLGKKNAAVNTERIQEEKTELRLICQELKILRQEIVSLTRTVNRSTASCRPVMESRSNALDSQLLIGLNQSFQQLLAESCQLSNHFNQLHDFVLKQTATNQSSLCTENIFQANEQNDELMFMNDSCASYKLTDGTGCTTNEPQETWPKKPDYAVVSIETDCGKRKGLRKGINSYPHCFLDYLENDLTSQGNQLQMKNSFNGKCETVGDCCNTNSNRNNSEHNTVIMKTPVTTLSRSVNNGSFIQDRSCTNGSPTQSLNSGKSTSISLPRFDALREMIYSEVATFISKHENRPHYLLELIRKLQKLKTNEHRQQAISAFDQIISNFLTDEQVSCDLRPEKMSGEVHLHRLSTVDGSDATRVGGFQGLESDTTGDVTKDEVSEGEEDEEGTESEMEEKRLVEGDVESCDGLEGNAAADGRCGSSSGDDVHYSSDFKSSSSQNEEEADEGGSPSLPQSAEATRNPMCCQNLDAVAEQMGFVTVEFVNPSSLSIRLSSEKEKGSSVSDESWEKAELPDKDLGHYPSGSDTSSEISEEIVIEDGSSESVEEMTLDQLQLKLTSISKEEIVRQMALECEGELSAQKIVETIGGEDPKNELAGDPVAENYQLHI